METVVKKASAGRVLDTTTFVLSAETPDRVNDLVVQRGWHLENFLQNPVALLSHQQSDLPVGIWKNLRVQGDALLGDLQLAAKGTSRMADLARGLIEQGILRAVSVGFKPLKAEPIKPRGMKYLEAELLEVSLVSVPAHPRAVMVAKSLGATDQEMKLFFTETLTSDAELGNVDGEDAQAQVASDRYEAIRKRAAMAVIAANRTLRNHP